MSLILIKLSNHKQFNEPHPYEGIKSIKLYEASTYIAFKMKTFD